MKMMEVYTQHVYETILAHFYIYWIMLSMAQESLFPAKTTQPKRGRKPRWKEETRIIADMSPWVSDFVSAILTSSSGSILFLHNFLSWWLLDHFTAYEAACQAHFRKHIAWFFHWHSFLCRCCNAIDTSWGRQLAGSAAKLCAPPVLVMRCKNEKKMSWKSLKIGRGTIYQTSVGEMQSKLFRVLI